MIHHPKPEFSRPVNVHDLAAEDTILEIEASADERAALAQRFGLVAVDSLTAKVHILPTEGGTVVHVNGHFRASVTQTCVVTLEPVTAVVEAPLTRIYAEGAGWDMDKEPEIVLSEDAEEAPEPFYEGVIDLGEAIAEQLALEIEPFPRAPGASFDGYSTGAEPAQDKGSEAQGPFAALARLRRRPGSDT